jgi:hypothetical protein
MDIVLVEFFVLISIAYKFREVFPMVRQYVNARCPVTREKPPLNIFLYEPRIDPLL